MENKKNIEEFKKIYSSQFGIELTDSEAIKLSSNFFSLFEALFQTDGVYLTKGRDRS